MSNAGMGGSVANRQWSSLVAPLPNDASKYQVFKPGQWEQVRWQLYDSAAYAAGGVSSIQFFQTPSGQGGKTDSDTNMQGAGFMPAGQMFLVEAIEVHFFPVTPTGGGTIYLPAAIDTTGAPLQINDAYVFRRSGNLKFTIGQKPYLQDAPMVQFTPRSQFDVSAALSDTTTAAATHQTRVGVGKLDGNPYFMSPDKLLLDSNAPFNVTLSWPEGVQALPSGFAARVVCTLRGELFRSTQ